MAKKKKDKSGKAEFPEDRIPSDAELDALLDQIEAQKAQETMDDTKDGANEANSEAASGGSDDRVAALELEMATLKDQALRAMAEAENVKKRAEREVAAAKVYGVEKFATDILSVVDNLGRALMTLDGKAKDDLGDNAKNLLEGIELTEKNLMAVLARHGIKSVPGKGSKFDPNVHQAVAQIPSEEDKGYVAEVMQVGFTIGERTLRAAMVAVSTGKG